MTLGPTLEIGTLRRKSSGSIQTRVVKDEAALTSVDQGKVGGVDILVELGKSCSTFVRKWIFESPVG